MKHLVSPNQLIDWQASRTDLVIFDCRFNLTDHNYAKLAFLKEHIAGAYFIDTETDLSGPKMPHGGNHPLPDPVAFKVLLESFGVSDDSTVVIYDHGDFNGPARMLMMLHYIGFKNGYVLDGGIQAYMDAGGQTESGPVNERPAAGNLTLAVDNDFIVPMNYVRDHLYHEGTVIVDSRSNSRYLGLEEPIYRLAGHIPSAKNYYYGDLIENARLKDRGFLQEHFADLAADKEIILTCGSGVSACVNSLGLRQLDIPHKIYIGSYSDWLSYPENEVKQADE